MPRTSVGNSSASIVPIESAAGAAATIAIGHERPEHQAVAEEEDDRAAGADEQARNRDRAPTPGLGDAPGEQDAEQAGDPRGDRAEGRDAGGREPALVREEPVRELRRGRTEDVGEESDGREDPEPAPVAAVHDLADPAPIFRTGRELLVTPGLGEVPGDHRDEEDRAAR